MVEFCLDMDGVISNWEKGALERLQLPSMPDGQTFDAWLQQHGESDETLWELIGDEGKFWRTLPVLPGASKLFQGLKRLGKVYIVSSCGNRLGPIAEAKEAWLSQHGFNATLIPLKEKHLLACPGRVLIDDLKPNCDEWHVKKGVACLFPTYRTGYDGSHIDAVQWVLQKAREIKDNAYQTRLLMKE